MYTPNPVVGGHGFRTSLDKLGEAASARNACAICHGHAQSGLGLGVPPCKYWRLYSASSPFSYTLSPVSNLNPSRTPSPYLKPQCHPSPEPSIGALPAWAAPPAAESRLFSTTTSRPRLITRAAASATSPCAGSRLSPFSSTPVPSTLAMARPEEVERLEAGAPNPHHPAAQVS